MDKKVLKYRVIVEKEHTEGGKDVYVAYAPSLGISDFGSTVDDAVMNVEQAMNLYINTLEELNQPIPEANHDDYFITSRKIKLGKSNIEDS